MMRMLNPMTLTHVNHALNPHGVPLQRAIHMRWPVRNASRLMHGPTAARGCYSSMIHNPANQLWIYTTYPLKDKHDKVTWGDNLYPGKSYNHNDESISDVTINDIGASEACTQCKWRSAEANNTSHALQRLVLIALEEQQPTAKYMICSIKGHDYLEHAFATEHCAPDVYCKRKPPVPTCTNEGTSTHNKHILFQMPIYPTKHTPHVSTSTAAPIDQQNQIMPICAYNDLCFER